MTNLPALTVYLQSSLPAMQDTVHMDQMVAQKHGLGQSAQGARNLAEEPRKPPILHCAVT
jgi:hypothetical protein